MTSSPPQNRPLRPAGQCNQSRIVSNGTTVEHYLNGTNVLQYELDSPALARGHREEQVQGHRAVRQAAERLHPAAGSRRPRLVPQHQDPAPARHGRERRRRPAAKGVQVVADDSGKRVDITIDGKPFTSYIYPDTLKKPVLYPIRTAERHARHARLPSRPAARASASITRITSASGSTTAT